MNRYNRTTATIPPLSILRGERLWRKRVAIFRDADGRVSDMRDWTIRATIAASAGAEPLLSLEEGPNLQRDTLYGGIDIILYRTEIESIEYPYLPSKLLLSLTVERPFREIWHALRRPLQIIDQQ